jgi:AraC family transcriptional regulator, arabinose operon regulatory protein
MEPTHSDFRIEKTTHLLHENSSRTVAEVAGACSLSTSRLSHLFKAEVGTTVGKFRRTCRFRKAKRMLADASKVAIKEIAYTCGYHHTSSFTRAFEHEVGESPSDYREHELQKKWRAAVTANKKHKRLTP